MHPRCCRPATAWVHYTTSCNTHSSAPEDGRNIFLLIYFQRDATLHSLFISGKLLYVFRLVSSPIIRSTYNCIYSIWYFLNITVICLYCGRVGARLSVVWELYRPSGSSDGHLQRVTIPDAVLIQFDLLMMSTTLLETCRIKELCVKLGIY